MARFWITQVRRFLIKKWWSCVLNEAPGVEEVVGKDEEVAENSYGNEDGDKKVGFGSLRTGILFVSLGLRIVQGHAETAAQVER